ncbi:MAG: hypothetical protein A2V90_03625 [Gammaproteobacteria bacterium RBG_16_57_12]|nr:MAG: hypothetical protein A2V90_03625 [Gammaproteobacteria bacterium RBG_16_57_12]
MIEETAQVVAVDGEYAWVETRRKTTCGNCAANTGCGTSVLQKVLGQKRNRLKVINHAAAQVGDEVVIGIQEQALVRGSLMVYMVPLLAMLAAAMLGEQFAAARQTDSELTVTISGLAGLLLGYLWLRHITVRIGQDERYQAVILRKQMQELVRWSGI